MDRTNLYRQEAVEAYRLQSVGPISVARSPGAGAHTLALLATVAISILVAIASAQWSLSLAPLSVKDTSIMATLESDNLAANLDGVTHMTCTAGGTSTTQTAVAARRGVSRNGQMIVRIMLAAAPSRTCRQQGAAVTLRGFRFASPQWLLK